MSVQSVEDHAKRLEEAQKALKAEMRRAVTNGVPKSAVARAAGVSRPTVMKWLEEQEDEA